MVSGSVLRIREAVPSDAPAIAKVHVDSWRTTYAGIVPDEDLASLSYGQREQAWQNILAHPDAYGFTLVAEAAGKGIVRFAVLDPFEVSILLTGENCMEFISFKSLRERGLGPQILGGAP